MFDAVACGLTHLTLQPVNPNDQYEIQK
jgi:hypothetical protein